MRRSVAGKRLWHLPVMVSFDLNKSLYFTPNRFN